MNAIYLAKMQCLFGEQFTPHTNGSRARENKV
jgi:hypothetical protein